MTKNNTDKRTRSRSNFANATNAGETLSPVVSHTKMVAAPRFPKQSKGHKVAASMPRQQHTINERFCTSVTSVP